MKKLSVCVYIYPLPLYLFSLRVELCYGILGGDQECLGVAA